jgi:hypothetical protein
LLIVVGLMAAMVTGVWYLAGGTFAAVVVFGLAIFILPLLHYLVWGWWLGKLLRSHEPDDEDERPFWERPGEPSSRP